MRHSPEFHRQLRHRGARAVRRRGRDAGPAMLLAAAIGIGAFAGVAWRLVESPVAAPVMAVRAVPASEGGRRVAFGLCHSGGGTDCVVDGDTFRMDGARIRIADIDAPETHPPRCAEEARLGAAATQRLQALLNAGPVTLAPADRDTDRYGRKLRIVTRGGVSLGEVLVSEGLARRWTGHREPWC